MKDLIPFHIPTQTATFSDKMLPLGLHDMDTWDESCKADLRKMTGVEHVLLTPSCTVALELSALLLDLQAGDEIILPSFTFVSSANPFVLRGVRLVFVDIVPETMNMDARLIEEAITLRTKAILVMHYGSIACDMIRIMAIARQHHLWVIEDAAHCVGARLNNQHLGTFGHVAAFSFHQSKNIHCFEGGALFVNDPSLWDRAQILSEKGTNRLSFLEGKSDRYTWVDIGLSASMSALSAAYLSDQLAHIDQIQQRRDALFERYEKGLAHLFEHSTLEGLHIAPGCQSNHHIAAIKCQDKAERSMLIRYLAEQNIYAYFHYVPLHSSPAGEQFGRFSGADQYTTQESERLLRLPLFDQLSLSAVDQVIASLERFYS